MEIVLQSGNWNNYYYYVRVCYKLTVNDNKTCQKYRSNVGRMIVKNDTCIIFTLMVQIMPIKVIANFAWG